MADRKRLTETAKASGGVYFPDADHPHLFIPSGCSLLDCVLGGGWPIGRVSNIVGDKAVGKSLLAIEACANFHFVFPKGKMWYREAEAAFDIPYAEGLGLPIDQVNFGQDGIDSSWNTVEQIFGDLSNCIKEAADLDEPGLYIIDSLDALSSDAELSRDIDKGSFGLEKQKMLGRLFRELIRSLKSSKIAVLIVSQVREKIGVVFGDKYTRTGGKSLDFYATIILMMTHMATLTRQVGGVKRATGVQTKVKATKNKITAPHREAKFTIRFGYGIDDFASNIDWLEEVKMLSLLDLDPKSADAYMKSVDALPDMEYRAELKRVSQMVRAAWLDIEQSFAPSRTKY